MPTYIIPPWQSTHGFPEYSRHPRIIRGCQPIQYPLGRVSTDSPDTLDILRLSVDANLYNTPLAEYPRIPRILWTIPGLSVDANPLQYPLGRVPRIPLILWTSPDYPWMPTHTIPPWQSIHGFPGYSGHPRIIRGCQPIQYPLDRVSTDSLDTLDIPGLSVDANPYNTPLAEYPRIPRILWTSPDYPWVPTYIIPPWQSTHGFPEYSRHPRIIRGCQPIQYPLGRVSTDSPDTLDIPGLSVDANPYNTPLAEYPRIPRILWTSPDYPWMPTHTIPP